MDRMEIKHMQDIGSPQKYQPVSLRQVAILSLCIAIIAFALVYLFEIDYSLLGEVGESAVFLGLAFGGFLYVLVALVSARLKHLPSVRELNRMLTQSFKNIGWSGIILLSVLAGVGEELLFRVFIQNAVSDWLGWPMGLLISSIAFGLAHFVSRLYVLVTFLMGLVFGLIYLATDSVLLIMTMHFFYDVCAFIVIVKLPHRLDLD